MDRQIYFAQCGDRIKIGIASNVRQRLAQLKIGAGAPLTLLGAVAGDIHVERSLHKKLKHLRIDGEWFKDCTETRAAIQNSLNNFPEPPRAADMRTRALTKLAPVAKIIWPLKTAEHMAALAKTDVRTARRWLAGESEPPAVILIAIMAAIAGVSA